MNVIPASSYDTKRFDYVQYDQEAQDKQTMFKSLFLSLAAHAETCLDAGRAKAHVLTKLEEAYMWIGKAIRDEQVAKRTAELHEQRSNE